MAAEPFTIYSYKIDPDGVYEVLKKLSPNLELDGDPANWSRITITERKFFKKSTITFAHKASYYGGADFPRQMSGMLGYFSRFPANELSPRILFLIQSFRFAIGVPNPTPDLDVTSDDPRMKYVSAIVKHLEGAIFTPSGLRDASGRLLFGAAGSDPAAVMPPILRSVPDKPFAEQTRREGGLAPDEEDPPPPTAERVARRALALAAVTGRVLLEQEDRSDPGVEQTRQRIARWVEEIGIAQELEPDEAKLLQHPLGTPPQRDVVNGTWRLEGLLVLSWALNRHEWVPYDQLCDPGKLLPSLAILNAERAKLLLAEPALRPPSDLAAMQIHLLGLYWRQRNFRLTPKPLDFVKFADNAWFGKLPLDGIAIVDRDLALQNHAIAQAPRDLVQRCESSAMERHLAINWLMGGYTIYSDTDTST